MKHTIHILSGVALLSVMPALAPHAQAQTAVVSSTSTSDTTSMGTISSFSPDRLVIHSETGTAPLSYRYTKTTTYVDEDGNPVSVETVKSGLPVTVYYTTGADGMIASKVIVHHAAAAVVAPAAAVDEKTSTTTTTTQ